MDELGEPKRAFADTFRAVSLFQGRYRQALLDIAAKAIMEAPQQPKLPMSVERNATQIRQR